jgi:hypothetical protein
MVMILLLQRRQEGSGGGARRGAFFFLIVPMVAKLSINPYNGIGILSAGAKKIS